MSVEKDHSRLSPLLLPAITVLTLGLAPFVPMPHFFEKIHWLATGHTFAAIDVFDIFMHGAPWAWLAFEIVRLILGMRTAPQTT